MNIKTKLRTATALAAACSALLAGCGETPRQTTERERSTGVKSETRYGDGWIYTVEHDGHWFVLEGRYSKGAMLHHPDCPCGKSR